MASNAGILPNLITIPKGYAPLNQDGLGLANLAAWHMQRIGNTGMLASPPEGTSLLPLGSIPNPAATQRRGRARRLRPARPAPRGREQRK